jgi:hypothetical protein
MTMVMSDSIWKIDYTTPTNQYGIWNGLAPSQFPDQSFTAIPGLFSGNPPLASGKVTERQSVAFVYSNASPQITIVLGHAAQFNKDSSADLTAPFNASVLSNFGSWTTC